MVILLPLIAMAIVVLPAKITTLPLSDEMTIFMLLQ
jgi:hypothetical protein